jgi:hypothetical protein
MKREYLRNVIAIIILHLLMLNNVAAQAHVWLFVDVPNPVPKQGIKFTTDLKIAAWKGYPGASDFIISYNTQDLRITNISIPQTSPFSPNFLIDSLSKPGEVRIASFKSANDVSWDKIPVVATITWFAYKKSSSETDINIKMMDQILTGWNSVEVEVFGQHLVLGPVGIDYIPKENNLIFNYPNPFTSSTTIDYQIIENSKVSITIYDGQGKLISILVDEVQSPGRYKAEWNGYDGSGNLSGSGIYICKMISGDFRKSIKMLMLK